MQTKKAISTHFDAVLHFIQKMDSDMISTLLKSKFTFQDMPKDLFIRKLGDLFWEFEQMGDFHLNIERGSCYGCSKDFKGYSFIGNKSKAYIDIMFITDEEDHVIDIYECDEFCMEKTGVKRKKRMILEPNVEFEIDDEEDPYDEDSNPFFGDDDIPF